LDPLLLLFWEPSAAFLSCASHSSVSAQVGGRAAGVNAYSRQYAFGTAEPWCCCAAIAFQASIADGPDVRVPLLKGGRELVAVEPILNSNPAHTAAQHQTRWSAARLA
jgi:hypothetical protein